MTRSTKKPFAVGSLMLAATALAAIAVASGSAAPTAATAASCTSPAGAKGPGVGSKTVGFIYVGSTSDFGYNEAAHFGAQALKKTCPNLKILEADTIPETSDMATAAEQEIAQGAKIIFSTSYGYKDYALTLAAKHPDVAFLQQGNFMTPPVLANANTYFGNVYETVYLGGIAAGKATKTGKLGFVAAFPIPQTLLNIDAFELGAQSVNPKVKTYVVFTGSWCDPGKQADAAKSLLQGGADVLSQHQDCTGTIIKAAEAKKAYSVGYHFDAKSLAPKGWLTGSSWNWGPLYGAMVKNILAGKFSGGPFNTNFSLGFSGGSGIASPMDLAPFGPSVATPTKAKITAAKAKILKGWSPFTGPIYDQTGKLTIAKGKAATAKELASLSYLVKGVVGSIPK
jgi:simple sugar transport system substrate-binding protein/basic membrane protein A